MNSRCPITFLSGGGERLNLYCFILCPIQTMQLDEELKPLHGGRDRLPDEKTDGACDEKEVERLRAAVTAVSEEREQLQEVLQGLREEHSQLKKQLEESNDMVNPQMY